MALSNIFREPRREITETFVGLLAFAAYLAITYAAACQFPLGNVSPINHGGGDVPFIITFAAWLAALPCVSMLLAFAGIFIHFIGEEVCDSLEDRGIHLRPRQRR